MAGSSSLSRLYHLLECSICLDLCSERIVQCKSGHVICSSHIPHLEPPNCPVCRIPYAEAGPYRNLLAEHLIQTERSILASVGEGSSGSVPTGSSQQPRLTPSVLSGTVQATPRPTGSIPSPNAQDPQNSCSYTSEGCFYKNNNSHARAQHEGACHFRPIKCCLSTNGCNNSTIAFGQYMTHLRNTHNVKSHSGSSHWNKYVLREDRKLVRDGSTSLFILASDNQQFLIRAVLDGDKILVWIAFHGRPQDGKKYTGKLKFDFQDGGDSSDEGESEYDEDNYEDVEDDYDDQSSYDEYEDQEGSHSTSSHDAGDESSFSGRVIATTRMVTEDVEEAGEYLSLSTSTVGNNLGAETHRGRFTVNYWALTVRVWKR